jgi:hypothetical protein
VNRLVSVFLALSACSGSMPPKPAPEPTPLPPVEKLPVSVMPTLPATHPDISGLAVLSASPRRLSIDQLERSFDAVANLPPGTVRLPPALTVTLGRPDYQRVTEENLEPNPLFMKFLFDIAVGACSNLSEQEPRRPAVDRLMTRFSTRDENVKFMTLRFTGLDGAAAEPLVQRLIAVHTAASSSTRPRAGYEAVCVALITSPEFLLY